MASTITSKQLQDFRVHLHQEERTPGTIEKYLRDVHSFSAWLDGREVTKELAAEWKEHLLSAHYAPVTINSMLAAVNAFFRFAGLDECRVRFLKIQRRMFRESARELTRQEYDRLMETARTLGGASGPSAGDHLCHRNPCVRGAVYHRGGRPGRADGDFPERKDSDDHSAWQALPQAAEVRKA